MAPKKTTNVGSSGSGAFGPFVARGDWGSSADRVPRGSDEGKKQPQGGKPDKQRGGKRNRFDTSWSE